MKLFGNAHNKPDPKEQTETTILESAQEEPILAAPPAPQVPPEEPTIPYQPVYEPEETGRLTDGVGTKLKLAFLMDKHDTVGIDCVAMCVNDIICCGARPLFFLDYIACGKNRPERIEQIVAGVSEGCVQAGIALIGGETAEMPGFYPEEEYDLAGYATGLVDREKIIDQTTMRPGDAVLALPSSGVHSNGFSLVRKVLDVEHTDLRAPAAELDGRSLGETLLEPTRIYVKPVLALLEKVRVRGISHITGGGFYENIPRSIPEGCCARIKEDAVRVLPVFDLIARRGNISRRDMFNTFNMGVGMVAAVAAEDVQKALEALRGAGEDAYVLGGIAAGGKGVDLC